MILLKRTGFTLVELVIAVALSAVVLLAASNLLINFGRFSSDFVKSEASLMGTALGAFEGITLKITAANKVAIPSTISTGMDIPATAYPAGCAASGCIHIRVSPENAGASADHAHDSVYTYWQDGTQLKYRSKVWDAGTSAFVISGDTVIATDIVARSLSFSNAVNSNQVNISLEAATHSGPSTDPTLNVTREHLATTVIMRSRSAS